MKRLFLQRLAPRRADPLLAVTHEAGFGHRCLHCAARPAAQRRPAIAGRGLRTRAAAVPACASFPVWQRPPSQARQKRRRARRYPAAGGSPARAPPCRGAVGVGVRPVATRSTLMCGVHEVICKRAAAPGCILWFPHLRTEAPNRCTFCSETRRRGPGRARLAPGPTRPAVTQPYALTLGGVRGVKCHALLTGLKI